MTQICNEWWMVKETCASKIIPIKLYTHLLCTTKIWLSFMNVVKCYYRWKIAKVFFNTYNVVVVVSKPIFLYQLIDTSLSFLSFTFSAPLSSLFFRFIHLLLFFLYFLLFVVLFYFCSPLFIFSFLQPFLCTPFPFSFSFLLSPFLSPLFVAYYYIYNISMLMNWSGHYHDLFILFECYVFSLLYDRSNFYVAINE